MIPDERMRIYRAFGLTPEEAEAFESSPEHQAWVRARAEADEYERGFLENARAHAARISADLNAKLNP